jgi:hypothetical protein
MKSFLIHLLGGYTQTELIKLETRIRDMAISASKEASRSRLMPVFYDGQDRGLTDAANEVRELIHPRRDN